MPLHTWSRKKYVELQANPHRALACARAASSWQRARLREIQDNAEWAEFFRICEEWNEKEKNSGDPHAATEQQRRLNNQIQRRKTRQAAVEAGALERLRLCLASFEVARQPKGPGRAIKPSCTPGAQVRGPQTCHGLSKVPAYIRLRRLRARQESSTRRPSAVATCASMKIYVKALAGKTFAVRAGPDESIEAIKYKIQDEVGIPAQQQSLSLAGRRLEGTNTLGDCNVQGTLQLTVNLTLNLAGGFGEGVDCDEKRDSDEELHSYEELDSDEEWDSDEDWAPSADDDMLENGVGGDVEQPRFATSGKLAARGATRRILRSLTSCVNTVDTSHSAHDGLQPEPVPAGSSIGVNANVHGRPIRNLGNTCFANAVLQATAGNTLALNSILSQDPGTPLPPLATSGLALLRDIVCVDRGQSTIVPAGFHELMVRHWNIYSSGQQMDAREFLSFLIDSLPSLGQICCFSERTLQGPEIAGSKMLSVAVVSSGGTAGYPSGFSLDALIHADCAGNRTATNTIVTPPRMLLYVNIKRFVESNGSFVKDPSRIKLDRLLRIYDENCDRIATYRLCGIVSHHGNAVEFGHYTAKSLRSGQWFRFDDGNAPTLIAEHALLDEATATNSYILVWSPCPDPDGTTAMKPALRTEVSDVFRVIDEKAATDEYCSPEGRDALQAALRFKAELGSIPPDASEWVINHNKDGVSMQLRQIHDEDTRTRRFSDSLIEKVVDAAFGDNICTRAARLLIDLGRCSNSSVHPHNQCVLDMSKDVRGLEMWNDRHNWVPHTQRPDDIVHALVHKMIVQDPILHELLLHKLNDPNVTVFLCRPEQAGKTTCCVRISWLSNICYGQAAYVFLRSGSGAKDDYFKFSTKTVNELNNDISVALIGHNRKDDGAYIKCTGPDYDSRIVKQDFLTEACMRGFMEPFLLHPFHLHCGDKTMSQEAARTVLTNKYPIIYSRLGTPGNVMRSQEHEMVTLANAYGMDKYGYLNLTLLTDECQQSVKVGTRVNEELNASLNGSDSLLRATIDLADSEEKLWDMFDLSDLEREQDHETRHLCERDSRSRFSSLIKSHVRISATTASLMCTFEQTDGRNPKVIELDVTSDYFGFETSKGIDADHIIEPEWVGGSDLVFLEQGDYPGYTYPQKLQAFCVDHVRSEMERQGYAHVLLHTMSAGSNAGLFEYAKFFVDYCNDNLPHVPVVAVTAYCYTSAGDYPGGPWLVFSDAALHLRSVIAEAATERFIDSNPPRKQKGQPRQEVPIPRDDQDAFHNGSQVGPGINALLAQHANDPSVSNCLQFPRNNSLFLSRVLRLLHESLERLVGTRHMIAKENLKLITVGNGMLKVGMTVKTDHHMMSVTMAILNATEKQISNQCGEDLSQAIGGRPCGPRAGDPYWDARGNSLQPRIILSGQAKDKLTTAKHLQHFTSAAMSAKPAGQTTDEAILNFNYSGMADADLDHKQWKAETPQQKRARENRGEMDPAAKMMKNAVSGATRGRDVGSEARNEGFETLAEYEDGVGVPEEVEGLLSRFLRSWHSDLSYNKQTASRYVSILKLLFRRGCLTSYYELTTADVSTADFDSGGRRHGDIMAAMLAVRAFLTSRSAQTPPG